MTDDPASVKPVRRAPTSRSDHREQRRAVLVQAAMRAIRQHGPDVAMDDIAAEAGISKPILYRHFLDKGDLYMAVSETATEQLRAVLLSGLSSEVDPRTLLRVVIEDYLTFIEREPELYRFVVRRSFPDRPLPRDPVTTNAALIAGALATIDINLLGPWRVTAAALPALRDSHGRVINVASGMVHVPLPFATAYNMSKRGLVAYSDALRVEHGDAIDVTTLYPGYIRTAIHAQAASRGLSLEGMVPSETVAEAARALAGAALGRPVRDKATSRRMAVGYFLLDMLPRRLLDRAVRARSGGLVIEQTATAER